MRTRKHSSPMETVWVDKHMYDEAERLHYERAAEQLVVEQLKQGIHAGNVNPDPPSDNGLKEDQRLVKNSKKQKRRRRSPKRKCSLPKLDCVLNELVSEHVWFDKYLYEEAECVYQSKLATDLAKALGEAQQSVHPSALAPSLAEGLGQFNSLPGQAAVTCTHSSLIACHHVVNDTWVNKVCFDSAERSFMEKFGALLAPGLVGLPLFIRPDEHDLPPCPTPDEGYITAVNTPATPGIPVANLITPQLHMARSADETVNGKPQWSGLQELIAEVWLEKPLYDDAERSFYETMMSVNHLPLKTEPCKSYKSETAKKSKKSVKSLKVSQKVKMNVGEGTLSKGPSVVSPVHYLVHPDSERVWLERCMFDKAESQYHASQALNVSSCYINDRHLTPPNPQPAAIPNQAHFFIPKKMAAEFLLYDKIWFDKPKYDDAEKQYYEEMNNTVPVSPCKKVKASPCMKAPVSPCKEEDGASTILRDIARARENIQKSLAGSAATPAGPGGEPSELVTRVANLELENQSLRKVVEDLQLAFSKLEVRLTMLEKSPTSHPSPAAPPAAAPITNGQPIAPAKKVEVTAAPEEDDDDIDLFGSDEEDEEAERIREERLKQYAEKKSKKPAIIAKSSILLDVKPWDDETDMAKLEECVRTVQMDGLLWGSSKLVPVGYGIKKLQIQCVVEDDKVGTDILEEEITKFEDYVQSVDIAAFNKI
ncbi:elongation factor 1-delta isoform X2 [Ambystoma mexicanum]|uniref:elongation factor 1-delta isoform X2 n=1 Tax=Ambystoma mexicanum TaxID=8296 RepID=UPI0037E81186